MSKKVAVFRREHFNAAHRLFNPAWDEAKNTEVFGLCALPNYHGHNYELEVKVTGEPDPATGYVIDLKLLSDIIKSEVHSRFDHKNLNLDTIEFKELNPTAENIAKHLLEDICPQLFVNYEIKCVGIKVYETPNCSAQIGIFHE